jgi:hypothetical protein
MSRRRLPEASGLAVVVQLTAGVNGITASFLIKPGEQQTTTIAGFMDTHAGLRRIMLPLTIRARVA